MEYVHKLDAGKHANELESLKTYVHDAYGFLKDIFNASDVQSPKVKVCKDAKNKYNTKNGTVILSQNLLKENPAERAHTIGEEVGHYLHFKLNPDIQQLRYESDTISRLAVSNFAEMIGAYAGFLWLEDRCGKKISYNAAKQWLATGSNQLAALMANGQSQSGINREHVIGYSLAAQTYLNDVDKPANERLPLAQLSRIRDLETIQKVMGVDE